MQEISLILTILGIHLLAVISPGPDFIMVIKNSLNYSRKAGIYTAIGIGSGIIIHITYTFLGLGILIKESPKLYDLLKYFGAAYILYIGIQSIRSNSEIKIINKGKKLHISNIKAFRIGFITNTLNVKASMFFLGLFTLIIKPDTNQQILVLIGFFIIIQTTLWFIIVSYFFTQPKIQKKYFKYQNVFNKSFGYILILLAIKVLFF